MTQHGSSHVRSRSELLDHARRLGVDRPERMTREELADEVERLSRSDDTEEPTRGLFGVARSMLASVVDRGLNLPDAARRIRGSASIAVPARNRAPVATVTLAEIYAAQGHKARALRMLDEVLAREPDHEAARDVRRQLVEGGPSTESDWPPAEEPRPGAAPSVSADVEPAGQTTEYVTGFVDTIGEDIQTGQPPAVADGATEPEVDSAELPLDESGAEEPTGELQATEPAVFWRQDEGLARIYWELPRAALEGCGLNEQDGYAALHLVGFVPQGTSPERKQNTLDLSQRWQAGSGVAVVDGFGQGVVLRVAIGWQSDGAFIPLSVGSSLESLLAESDLDDDPSTETALGRATVALPVDLAAS